MSAEIRSINSRLKMIRAEIEVTQELVDAVIKGLEDARAEEIRLARLLETKILEDALTFPSVIYP